MTVQVEELVQKAFRRAGRKAAEVRVAYREGRESARDKRGADRFDLPVTEDGDARIVCRRAAEQCTVPVSIHGRPPCFDPESVDCQGCIEDIHSGCIETW